MFLVKVAYPILRKVLSKIKLWNDNIMLIAFFALACVCASIGKYDNRAILPLIRTGFLIFFYHLGFFYRTRIEEKYKVHTLIYFSVIIVIQLIILKIGRDFTYDLWKMHFKSNVIVSILGGLTGIFFWLKIAEIIEPLLRENKIINYIGNNTSTIMYHHLFFIFALNTIIYILSGMLDLSSFDTYQYRRIIYYEYTSGLEQFKIIYFTVAMAGPLISKYIYEKVVDKIRNYGNTKALMNINYENKGEKNEERKAIKF